MLERERTKENLIILKDAIKHQIENKNHQGRMKYIKEYDLINMVVFLQSAASWQRDNPSLHEKGKNMRDFADEFQLRMVANVEVLNALLIELQMPYEERFNRLLKVVDRHFELLAARVLSKMEQKRLLK